MKASPVQVWITNTASPYRRPLWDEIAKRVTLRVVLLENDARLRRAARRGADWAEGSIGKRRWAHQVTRTIRFARGEREFFVADPVQLAWNLRRATSVLIGGWESPAYWQALVLARLRRARVVGFYESTLSSNHFKTGPIALARAFFFRRLDAVVVPGQAAQKAVLAMGVDSNRIHVGFNAVDVQHFHDEARSERARSQTAIAGHHFVFIGQLIERKNVDGLIRAFARIRNDGDRLTIIGSGTHESTLMDLVSRLGLTREVSFKEAMDNVSLARSLATGQTLVMPSHEEVWGLVANEGLACGLHAVVSPFAGVADSIRHMQGVYISTDSSYDSVAKAMVASRSNWKGWIDDPEILRYTPTQFAQTFIHAILNTAEAR